MKLQIFVTLKKGVLDPQGVTIHGVLAAQGYNQIASVKQGKFFEVDVDATDANAAKEIGKKICESLLANTVIEDYRIEIA